MKSKIYHKGYDPVFDASENASIDLNFSLDSEDKERGLIRVSTPMTALSWGENIVIKIEEVDKDRTEVTVNSSPKAQLFDWGKSKKNESSIIEELDMKLEG
jgi:hypothetical protein